MDFPMQICPCVFSGRRQSWRISEGLGLHSGFVASFHVIRGYDGVIHGYDGQKSTSPKEILGDFPMAVVGNYLLRDKNDRYFHQRKSVILGQKKPSSSAIEKFKNCSTFGARIKVFKRGSFFNHSAPDFVRGFLFISTRSQEHRRVYGPTKVRRFPGRRIPEGTACGFEAPSTVISASHSLFHFPFSNIEFAADHTCSQKRESMDILFVRAILRA